jgi:hypothetical protein
LKYRPEFPDRFGSFEDAHAFSTRFFGWLQRRAPSFGIGFHTPADVHYGRAELVHAQRATVLDAAYAAHPERFVASLQHRPRCQQRRGSTSLRGTCPAQRILDQPVSPKLTASEALALQP